MMPFMQVVIDEYNNAAAVIEAIFAIACGAVGRGRGATCDISLPEGAAAGGGAAAPARYPYVLLRYHSTVLWGMI